MSKTDEFGYCLIASNTDVGRVRKANEDWLDSFDCKNGRVAVVCDGMGGHVGGAVASRTAVEAIRVFLTNNCYDDPQKAIADALDEANEAILRKAQSDRALQGMGSTGLILIVRDGKVYYGSVGDSRIYLIREHNITRLTKDESYVQMLVDAGMDPMEAEHHPRKNEITNALGIRGMTRAKTGVIEDPRAGDSYMLCSDGLTGMVSEATINKIVSNKNMVPQQRVDQLIELANKNGGHDNITVEIVEFVLNPPGASDGYSWKSWVVPASVVIGVAVVGILWASWYFLFERSKDVERTTERIELAGMQFAPGAGEVEILSVINKADSSIVRFNQKYLDGQPDYIIAEAISPDSVRIDGLRQKITQTPDSMKFFIAIPDDVRKFPEKITITLSGDKQVHLLTSNLKAFLADSGKPGGEGVLPNKDNAGPEPLASYVIVDEGKTSGLKEYKSVSTYNTSCKTIEITLGRNDQSEADDVLRIVTDVKLKEKNVISKKYEVKFNINDEGKIESVIVTIKDVDKNVDVLIEGEKEDLKIRYHPEETETGNEDPSKDNVQNKDPENKELKFHDI